MFHSFWTQLRGIQVPKPPQNASKLIHGHGLSLSQLSTHLYTKHLPRTPEDIHRNHKNITCVRQYYLGSDTGSSVDNIGENLGQFLAIFGGFVCA